MNIGKRLHETNWGAEGGRKNVIDVTRKLRECAKFLVFFSELK